ncbi:tryptophan synthase subunit alpha [Litoribacter alkaliphilus]|uniref:Tryptophan synthase alpha chain n=1 Tax=Litoribacter ruber TaxID=702568 RepID=A0AAP2G5Z8_9BACT|nr:tryptophan synthase subunit alpha [Litoribacter alkaliphilus]MBS9525128.1 tryptophan synthase subunit alpha [Litoribacter alkaliphilus]
MKTKNRIDTLFRNKQKNVLSIYFTAGYPKLEDTVPVMEAIEAGGADIIEVGMPFSDPVADGPTIQESNKIALDNGMSLKKLFAQLAEMRKTVSLPVILMGYLNPIIQFGVEKFCQKCQEVGVDGLILPDLPMQQFLDEFKEVFSRYGLRNTFLISPQTSDERIKAIDEHSDSFIYMVSSHSITGAKSGITQEQERYFERVGQLGIQNPRLIGFGISDHESFTKASKHAHGAIIGSAFIKVLNNASPESLNNDIGIFIKGIKNGEYDYTSKA